MRAWQVVPLLRRVVRQEKRRVDHWLKLIDGLAAEDVVRRQSLARCRADENWEILDFDRRNSPQHAYYEMLGHYRSI